MYGRGYIALSQHLKTGHHVRNADERLIFPKLGTGRIQTKKETCPVPGCSYSSRLDKHLKEWHSELSTARRHSFRCDVKRTTALRQLAELRASNPNPPMASSLDLEAGQEEEEP